MEKFIYSLGIRHIGQENAKLLSKNFQNPENFFNLSKDKNFNELLNIDGIGETQIKSLKKFFSNKKNILVITELKKILDIIPDEQVDSNGILRSQTFMFTGKLSVLSRAEAKSLVEKNSGKIVSNVSKKLDYLVIGEKPTQKKINLAKNLKIKVINEKEFLSKLNISN